MKKQSNPYPPIEAVRLKPSPAPPRKKIDKIKTIKGGVPIVAIKVARNAYKEKIDSGYYGSLFANEAKYKLSQLDEYIEHVEG